MVWKLRKQEWCHEAEQPPTWTIIRPVRPLLAGEQKGVGQLPDSSRKKVCLMKRLVGG